MEIEFTSEAKKDLEYWKKSGNSKVLKRIRQLIESIQETPFDGIGKPEALKFDLAGKWSRRINKADRII
jgi:toxin YoeB